mgnify:CR=1 FL=1
MTMKIITMTLCAALPMFVVASCAQPAPIIIHETRVVKPTPKPKPKPSGPESFRAVESAN